MSKIYEEPRNNYKMTAYADKESNTCAVSYDFTEHFHSTEFLKACKLNDLLFLDLDMLEHFFTINNISSKSKTDDVDDFDMTKGFDVADLKCSYKYHQKMAKKYRRLIERLHSIEDTVTKLEKKHKDKLFNIEEDYDRCYLGVNPFVRMNAVIPSRPAKYNE